jgi:hypothetical protein
MEANGPALEARSDKSGHHEFPLSRSAPHLSELACQERQQPAAVNGARWMEAL